MDSGPVLPLTAPCNSLWHLLLSLDQRSSPGSECNISSLTVRLKYRITDHLLSATVCPAQSPLHVVPIIFTVTLCK